MLRYQKFKSVYFSDYKNARGITLAFNENNVELYKQVSHLTASQLRQLLETNSYSELAQRAVNEGLPLSTYCLWHLKKKLADESVSFIEDNKKIRHSISDFENKVIQGDCLDVMREIPAASVDMILCDLPYGTTQNPWDSVIPLEQLWQEYERVIKERGTIVLTGQGLFTAKLMLSNPKLFKYKITWVKSKSTNFLNAKKQPLRKHEDICIFYKSQPVYNPQMSSGEPYNKGFRKNQLTGSYGDFKTVEVKSAGERYPTDVVYFKTAESEGEVFHPTQKPVELGQYLIRTFTKTNDIVLDNTCGSGSFLVSAILEGRKFIGIEKNKEAFLFKNKKIDYIEVCKKRIKKAQIQYATKTRNLELN